MVSQPQRVKYSLCKQAAKLRDAQEGEGDVGGARGGWLCEGPLMVRGAHLWFSFIPTAVLTLWGAGMELGRERGRGGDFAAMFNIQVT